MKFLKFLAVLFISMILSAFAMSSNANLAPQKTVIDFISDYEKWNEEATQNLSEDTGFQAKNEYAKLLKEYCTESPGRIGYDVYGQYSLHVVGGEKILITKRYNKEIIIKTSIPSRFGRTDADVDYFEYHLVLDKNKYLIEEVYQLLKSGEKTKTL